MTKTLINKQILVVHENLNKLFTKNKLKNDMNVECVFNCVQCYKTSFFHRKFLVNNAYPKEVMKKVTSWVKARSRKGQGKVKAKSGQGQSKVKRVPRQSQGNVKLR